MKLATIGTTANLVDSLERLLEDARAGLVDHVICAVLDKENFVHCWDCGPRNLDNIERIGLLEIHKMRIYERAREEA